MRLLLGIILAAVISRSAPLVAPEQPESALARWYFMVDPGTEQCIMEMSEADYALKMAYTPLDIESAPGLSCEVHASELSETMGPVTAQDGSAVPVLTFKVQAPIKNGETRHVSYVAHRSHGWVKMCLVCNGAAKRTKWVLSFEAVAEAWVNSLVDPTEGGSDTAGAKDMKQLSTYFTSSSEKASSIMKVTETLKEHDVAMRNQIETINERIMYVQGALLLCTVAIMMYQSYSMVRFLKKSRII